MILRIVGRALFGSCLLAFLLIGIAVYATYSKLPSVEILKDIRLQVPLKIFSADAQLIAEFGEIRRTPIPFEQIPKTLIHAVLATEDRRFYEHPGVDMRGLLRSSLSLLTTFSKKQGGGSTITMQIARNFFLTRKISMSRKLSEILLAFEIEKELSKDEILALYLNKIYFGKRAYGVVAAAHVYYGKTVDQLSLDQIAMLAGLPQAPSSINPFHNPEAAYKRRKHVLDRMRSYGFIAQKEYDAALHAPMPIPLNTRPNTVEAPYVAEMVRQALFAQYGDSIYESGFEVYTTIDSSKQEAANQALRRALLEYDQRHGYRRSGQRILLSRSKTAEEDLSACLDQLREIPGYPPLIPGVVMRIDEHKIAVLIQDGRYIEIPWKGLSWARPQTKNHGLGPAPQKPADVVQLGDLIYAMQDAQEAWKMAQIPEVGAALVAIEPQTGALLALVGGFDYALSSFNRATQAERLPGSNFKPFLYAAALSEGYTLASVINDAPVIYTDPSTGVTWRPQNDTKKFYGPTRLRVSLKRSQNMVTIRLLRAIGIPKFIAALERFGFRAQKCPPYLSLALGTAQVTPLEMASAYSALANGGQRCTPYWITRIKDYQGKIIYEAPKVAPVPVIDPRVAFLITSALQDAIQSGTGQRAKSLGRKDLAGKTGTTNDYVDAWYSGYNPKLAASAWIGFNDSRSVKEYGSMATLPIWMYFMEAALKGTPDQPLRPPAGIIRTKIDPETGLLAQVTQSDAIYEFFTEETLPTDKDGSGTPQAPLKPGTAEDISMGTEETSTDLPPNDSLF